MRRTGFIVAAAIAAAPLAGCVGPEDTLREGVTLGGGEAIAHNSALQIIDPWPPGVQETDLRVPAEREDPTPAAGAQTSVQPAV